MRCGVPRIGAEALCRRCRQRLFAVERIRAAFPYEPPIRELLHAFKYRRHAGAGALLAAWLAAGAGRFPELARARAAAAVPLHPRRLKERGFNQAQLLAEAVARSMRLALLDGLRRERATSPLWGLSREGRQAAVEGAFSWRGAAPPRAVLLIDDVCTSGGTLEACGRALQRAGVEEVQALVLARD